MKCCKSMLKLLTWELVLFVPHGEDASGPVYVLARKL